MITVFLGYVAGAMTLAAAVFASGLTYFALQNHSQRAQIDSLTQANTALELDNATLRDLLVGELTWPLTSKDELS